MWLPVELVRRRKKTMLDRRFPICSANVPLCLGREALLDRMTRALSKPTPDHLQVIGPRFAGKTVLIGELVRRFERVGKPYVAAFICDLAHQRLTDDRQFIHSFGIELARALRISHPTYAEHLETESDISAADISEVLDALKSDGCKVLAVWDGFDKVVANVSLTRNLWDQLRELAINPSLRLVTVSRKRLSELIRDPNTETSPFWNIFEPTPIRVGPYDDQDVDALLLHTPELHVSTGARTELLNATNASPLLTLEVLNSLLANGVDGEVDAQRMREACDLAYLALRDRIGLLWSDCPPSAQDLLHRICEVGSVSRGEAPAADGDTLMERGFVHSTANKLQRTSGLLLRYLKEQPHDGNAFARLFGSPDAFQKNFKAVLERRIAHLDRIDAILHRYLRQGLEDLPEFPSIFLSHIRNIADRAFELIWKAEIPNRRVPSEWMSIWKLNDERGIDRWETTFPQGVHRVRLLNLMTGTERSVSCAKCVTRGTYVLMSAVHAFGDFGQHQEGAPIDLGAAYSALYLCVELTAALRRELPEKM
jgi:hypothetical protein